LAALIAPNAPVAKTGRPPFGLKMMLRIHCLQQRLGLSHLAAEEALFEMSIYRNLVGLSGTNRIPDRVSILRFTHLLEEHSLSPRILQLINDKLTAQGLMLKVGTVVDAILIAAPSSTKNKDGQCDPEMHQTKKGNQRHFGKKCHVGIDVDSGLVHSVIGTAANVNDVNHGHALLHWQEQVVFADAGYQGAPKRDFSTGVDWHIAMRPGKRKQQKHAPWGALAEQAEKLKAGVRAKVEHPFGSSKDSSDTARFAIAGWSKTRHNR
jgi:IS5 family transposase